MAQGPCTPDVLLQRADLALDRAKRQGRGCILVFTPAIDAPQRLQHRLRLELGQMLDRGEFASVYQPIIDLASGATMAFEALLRWHHSQQAVVLPSRFITMAKEAGLIVDIGAWALLQACADTAHCPAPVRVAVLSPVQFARRPGCVWSPCPARLASERPKSAVTERFLL